mmetsp:Transcript_1491/g.3301  ORF Transcript_1491/g.3301 Transcript_1491/m.3301 type:complete len:98 (+) Transcript_1491:2399-2692(+)
MKRLEADGAVSARCSGTPSSRRGGFTCEAGRALDLAPDTSTPVATCQAPCARPPHLGPARLPFTHAAAQMSNKRLHLALLQAPAVVRPRPLQPPPQI